MRQSVALPEVVTIATVIGVAPGVAHGDGDQRDRAQSQSVPSGRHVVNLTAPFTQLGAEHLVVIPDFWRSDTTAEMIEPRTLSDESW